MTKVICIYLCALLLCLAGCQTTPTEGPINPPTTTQPPLVSEPGEKPVHVSELGLKTGKCFRDGNQMLWKQDHWHGDRVQCDLSAKLGQGCTEQGKSCKLPDGTKLMCAMESAMKCYGWVYEKDIVTGQHKPLKDASVDLFNMPFCMVGMCDAIAGPVKTNEFGYFELITKEVPDSTNVRAYKAGMYGACYNNKPHCTAGKCSAGDTIQYPTAHVRGIPLMQITETSCN